MGMKSLSYNYWSTSDKLAFIDAVTHFPMSLYCKKLFVCDHTHCLNTQFLPEFFMLLFDLVRNFIYLFS